MKKSSIVVVLLLASGCNKLKLDLPPVPPSWDSQCVPDDSAYVDMAWEERDKPPALKPGTTPQQAKQESLERINAAGYELTVGLPPGYDLVTDDDQNFGGVTLPGHVYVSEANKKEMDADKTGVLWAAFLRHEETHVRQQLRLSLEFFVIYKFGEGRLLAIETPAYDVQYQTYVFFAEQNPEFNIIVPTPESYRAGAEGIFKKYSGAHIPMKCFQDIAVEVWMTN